MNTTTGAAMTHPDDDVIVQITITEAATYSCQAKMKRSKFEELDRRLSTRSLAERRKVEVEIAGFIDRAVDWQDSEDPEIEEFEIVERVDADDKEQP
jgi:hypothetical protein